MKISITCLIGFAFYLMNRSSVHTRTLLVHLRPSSSTFTFLWPLSIIFDILEVPAFGKYSTWWVSALFCLCLTLPWSAMVCFRSIYSSFERSNGTGWDVFNSPYTCFKHKNSLKDNQWYFILAREWILQISLSLCLGNSLCFISSVW